MTAVGAGIAMTAERCGTRAQNGAKGFELLKAGRRGGVSPQLTFVAR